MMEALIHRYKQLFRKVFPVISRVLEQCDFQNQFTTNEKCWEDFQFYTNKE